MRTGNCCDNLLKYVVLVTVSIYLIFEPCLSIRFFIKPHQKRCLKHEMYANQLAVGEYEVSNLPDTVVDMTITDSKDHTALRRDNIDGKGKFAVTSDGVDYYYLCFTLTVPPGSSLQSLQREISLDFKVGAEAKSYEKEDADKLSELEVELRRLQDLTEAVIMDFAYLKKREQEMRDTNESTNTRISYQSVISVIILLVLATWQVLYLRTYFRARKLID